MPSAECEIVLVDDHPLLGAGLRSQLDQRGVRMEIAPVIETTAIVEFIESRRPRIVLLDYSMPAIGVSTPLIPAIRSTGAEVVVLTGTIDHSLWGSLIEAGALGVMGKDESLEQLLDGIESVLAGEDFRPGKAAEFQAAWRAHKLDEVRRLAPFRTLSGREAAVAAALIRGEAPKDIAAAGFVSVGTVRSQLKSIYRKLGVASQLELISMARDAKWPD